MSRSSSRWVSGVRANLHVRAVPVARLRPVPEGLGQRGAFRLDHDHELDGALELLAGGLPVGPVITHELAVEDAVAALDTAGDRSVASKVLLHFG